MKENITECYIIPSRPYSIINLNKLIDVDTVQPGTDDNLN